MLKNQNLHVKTAVFSWMCHLYYVFSISKQLQIDISIPGIKKPARFELYNFLEVETYRAVDTVRTTKTYRQIPFLQRRLGHEN
jgi:hypothetical protein